MFESLAAFRDAIRSAGLEPPDAIVPGKLHRFPGSGKRHSNRAAWCVLFDEGLGGCFGGWSSGFSTTWQATRDKLLSPGERAAFARRAEAAKAHAAQDRRARQARTARRATAIWRDAIPAPESHAYLKAKRIPPCGARFLLRGSEPVALNGCLLVVPLHDLGGRIRSLQCIDWKGEKRFLYGGAVNGRCCALGDWRRASPVYVAEGFATAATLHLATHKPVLAAFSTHNLEPVAKALRRQRHGVRIIVAADNDRFTQGNPGITAGRMAARAVGADLIFPEFPPGVPGTDFNDLNLAGCFR